MEAAFIILTTLLILFAFMAIYDGFFLHIFRFELQKHPESKTEHLIHTIRAFLFPPMIYFLFIAQNCTICFYIGICLVLFDLIVLGIDAYMEKDSRTFMGGLPRWEYILHLFVNGFHFAAIAVFLSIKIQITDQGVRIVPDFYNYNNFRIFRLVAVNLIPGGIIIALLHLLVSYPATSIFWDRLRGKIVCCKIQ